MPFDPVRHGDGVFYPAPLQGCVKDLPVLLRGERSAVLKVREHRAVPGCGDPGVNDGLYLWGHGDGAAYPCLGFYTANKRLLRRVVVSPGKGDERRGPESEVAVGEDIVRIGDGANAPAHLF